MNHNSHDIEPKVGFDAIRRAVEALCISATAREYAREMAFSDDFELVSNRLNQTAEMLAINTGDSPLPIAGIGDHTQQLRAIRPGGTWMPAQDLHHLRSTLRTMAEIERFFARARNEQGRSAYPALDPLATQLDGFVLVTRTIDRVLDQHGEVLDHASPELADIRRRLSEMGGVIASTMRRVMAKAAAEGYLEADTAPSMRHGRLVIPVAPMHKRRIPGIVQDESASGKTCYIEPAEVVEANNRLRELEIEERREIARILTGVADVLRGELDGLLAGLDLLGQFDFIHAKARYAQQIDGVLPTLHPEPQLEWYHACHPGLRQALERAGKQIVPLDITLTADKRMLLVSGPNAGGKSVTLKTVGVVQYMLQCGLLPPVYEQSHFGIFSNIMVEIGDDQSMDNELSTYSSHLSHMREFLQNSGDRSLILIDEFGSGTEPQVGAALAQAILGRFISDGAYGVITSHFRNLILYADSTPGMVNGSMLYDRQRMQPMFKLAIGQPGTSFALDIARKIGLPGDIIDSAAQIVGSDYVNFDKYIADINRDRRYWENKRRDIRQKEKRLDEILEQYHSDAGSIHAQRKQILAEARDEAKRIMEGANAAIERTIRDIRNAQAERQRTLQARQALEAERQALTEAPKDEKIQLSKTEEAARRHAKRKPQDAAKPAAKAEKPKIEVGSHVLLDGQGQPGTVMELNGKTAIVAFGQLKTTVKLNRLQLTLRLPQSGAQKSASFVSSDTRAAMRERQLQFSTEIDVRGMRADEALQAVMYFIDDAIQFNSARVRILHGTGTGALRQCIRQYLDTIPGVKTYHDEDVRFGGAGITVVNL